MRAVGAPGGGGVRGRVLIAAPDKQPCARLSQNKRCNEDHAPDRGDTSGQKSTFLDFPKGHALTSPRPRPAPYKGGGWGVDHGVFSARETHPLSSVALPHAATTLASKGLGAANRLIVACDTLKLRATSACASPFASLCMASRR